MTRMLRNLVVCLPWLGLIACSTVPPTITHQRSVPPMLYGNGQDGASRGGSLFPTGGGRSIFEDRRARYVGDMLTINIVEKNTASTKSGTKTGRDSALSAGVTAYSGLPAKNLMGNLNLGLNSKNEFDSSGESTADNTFTSTITASVVEVLPNGNMVVSGEKQVSINQGNEFIRFSGIVNPANITTSNSVNSSQVADARIEYRGSGYLAENQQPGWLARIFLNVLPF